MAKGFSLEIDPWAYRAKFQDGTWIEEYVEKPHLTPREEAELPADKRAEMLLARNNYTDMPVVNYTTQYGMGCFEGLKAFPQPDGTLSLFRPDENARRMASSMKGLRMPPFPEAMFLTAVRTVVGRNKALGFAPAYDPAWKADDFVGGSAVYVRPFTYAEPGIGVGISKAPWVIVVTTPVGSYFKAGNSKAVTTRRVRANPGGTGWIKADSNYVTSALAKIEAEQAGYMEAVFLDAREHEYFEEGSSCNIFFVMKDGTLVTPSLEDTILPGITRRSILVLAGEKGVRTEERRVSVTEMASNARECFVSGTAAGITPIESITHEGRETVFCSRGVGEVTRGLLKTLKGIQYGAVADTHHWMFPAL
ncbi:MAG TPA: branched-chain-amino-acid transaminase [Spirochaetia bacterium]|nr:branched-chain-amino-acid transaminase [Spirochaetia bacterium]